MKLSITAGLGIYIIPLEYSLIVGLVDSNTYLK